MQDDSRLSKRDREDYLIKLGKEFAFAGASVPERISVDGEDIALRAYVFAIARKKGRLTREEQEEVDRVAALARKKRGEIVSQIASEDLTKQEAEELYMTALGLDRALDTLYRAHEPRASVAEEQRKAKVEEGQRWLNLVKRIYARDRLGRDGFQ